VARASVIIVNWNTRDLLARCVSSVLQTTSAAEVDIVVVDNASSDGSCDMLRARFPSVRQIMNRTNLGFGRANNQAAEICSAPYLLLLNSDAQLQPQALDHLLALADQRSRAAVIGARLLHPDRRFQSSHIRFPTLGRQFLVLSGIGRLLVRSPYPSFGPEIEAGPQRVEWVSGACMLVRREAFVALGGFDTGYFMYGEEMDLCYRLRQSGWEVWYHPAAVALHEGSASQSRTPASREAQLYRGTVRFFRKHRGSLAAQLMSAQILTLTAIKTLVHGTLRACTGGRWGRTVVALSEIRRQLRDEVAAPVVPAS
jgi:GT2 family glycosyltransferase